MSGKVYLLSINSKNNIYYKIGRTKLDVNERISKMQTGNPEKIEILFFAETSKPSKLEAFLHKYYKQKRVSGEWFILDNDDINKFLILCENFNKNEKINNEFFI